MRVLVITAWAPWRLTDGGSLVLYHHLRHLVDRHDLTVVAAGAGRREALVPAAEAGISDELNVQWFGTAVPPSVDYAIRRVRSEMTGEPAAVFWIERSGLVRFVRDELARRPPDVLHLHGWGTARLTRLAPSIPSVHMPIDAWSLGLTNRLLPAWRPIVDYGQPRKIEAHERRHYPRCGAVVVVAPHDAEHLRRLAPDARIEVVPNGVEPGPEPGRPAEGPVIGFHGAYETAANRDAALALANDVFPLIRARMPDARLMLIGRDPGPEIRRLAGEGVEVTGAVPDVRGWLARVAVYVAPMVSGWGMKNKVLEAMAAGLPVVATPLAVEGIGAGPGIFVAPTAERLAERALALLEGRSERVAAGAEARARVVADFSWERSAAGIERLWAELAGDRR